MLLFMKLYSYLKMVYTSMVSSVVSPKNLSYLWNLGSFLLLSMFIQILSGILLSMLYTNHENMSFIQMNFVTNNIQGGFILRVSHLNGASLLFILLYSHMFRGMYYNSFKFKESWNSGMLILILSMMVSFLGYVLPWGQMSFWAATVITKFVSAVPVLGETLLKWVWGGYSVGGYTLKFFFTLHFLTPLVLMVLVFLHLVSLHQMGSSNTMSLVNNNNKMMFSKLYLTKDLINITAVIVLFMLLLDMWMTSEMENFKEANYMVAPAHITPEWYFLFTYAILRSVPNKMGGVLLMLMSLIIIMMLSVITKKYTNMGAMLTLTALCSFFMLSWVGSQEATDMMAVVGVLSSMLYFSCFTMCMIKIKIWNYMM